MYYLVIFARVMWIDPYRRFAGAICWKCLSKVAMTKVPITRSAKIETSLSAKTLPVQPISISSLSQQDSEWTLSLHLQSDFSPWTPWPPYCICSFQPHTLKGNLWVLPGTARAWIHWERRNRHRYERNVRGHCYRHLILKKQYFLR